MALIDLVWQFAYIIIAFIIMIGIAALAVASFIDIFVEADPLARMTLRRMLEGLLRRADETGNTVTKVFAIFLIYFRWALLLALDLFIIWVMLNFAWMPPWLRSWIRSVFPF